MDSECLERAVEHGNLNKVNSFLRNCSPQYINTMFYDMSLLHFAIECADHSQLEFSEQHVTGDNCKCLPTNQDSSEQSCRHEGDEIILSLINAGADVNSRRHEFLMTPLMSALRYRRDCDVLHRLIDAGSDVNAQCSYKKIPLMYAIGYKCNKKIINKLINIGSNVNHRDDEGWTPLCYAVQFNKDPEIVHMLINAGADVNVLYDEGQNLLMGIEHVREKCIDENCSNRVLIDALISHGIDVKCVDFKGNSILHLSGCKYLMEIAVKYGVSINLLNSNGKTALNIATDLSDLKRVKKLLSLGADPNCGDIDLSFPFHSEHYDIIAFLFYYGARLNDVNARLYKQMNFLLNSVSNYKEFVKLQIREYFKHFLLFENEHGFSENGYFLKLDDFVTKHLHSFKKECKKELCGMQKIFISDNLTFYQFCNLKRLHTSEILDISVTNYNYSYKQIKNLFPVYQNMIILRMKNNQISRLNRLLRKYLERIDVRPLTCQKTDSDVSLGYDCMYDICRFLNQKQVYNLFLSSFV